MFYVSHILLLYFKCLNVCACFNSLYFRSSPLAIIVLVLLNIWHQRVVN
jgi:hypothetical protein